MFPESAVQIIMEGWNDALSDAIKNGQGTKYGKKVCTTTASSKRPFASLTEVYNALGTLLLCVGNESKSVKVAHKAISVNQNVTKWNRFKNVLSQLGMSDNQFDELLNTFHKTNLKHVIVPFFSCIDDTTIGWNGGSIQKNERKKKKKKKNKFIKKTNEIVPNTVVIPSKPQPVSVLLHGDVFKFAITKKPFAVKFVMRHSSNRISFHECMVQLLEAAPYKGQSHVWVADSAFGSWENLKKFDEMDCQVILSTAINKLGPLSILLNTFCTKKGSVLIINRSENVLSMHHQNSRKNKFLLTNAVHECTSISIPENDDQSEQSEEQIRIVDTSDQLDGYYKEIQLKNLTKKNLEEICLKSNLPKSGNKEQLAKRIFRHYSEPERNDFEVKLLNQIKSSQLAKKKSSSQNLYERI